MVDVEKEYERIINEIKEILPRKENLYDKLKFVGDIIKLYCTEKDIRNYELVKKLFRYYAKLYGDNVGNIPYHYPKFINNEIHNENEKYYYNITSLIDISFSNEISVEKLEKMVIGDNKS